MLLVYVPCDKNYCNYYGAELTGAGLVVSAHVAMWSAAPAGSVCSCVAPFQGAVDPAPAALQEVPTRAREALRP